MKDERGTEDRNPGTQYSVLRSKWPDFGEAIQMAGFGSICRGFSTAIGVHAKIGGVAYDQNSYQWRTPSFTARRSVWKVGPW